jgi:hypothetical protein
MSNGAALRVRRVEPVKKFVLLTGVLFAVFGAPMGAQAQGVWGLPSSSVVPALPPVEHRIEGVNDYGMDNRIIRFHAPKPYVAWSPNVSSIKLSIDVNVLPGQGSGSGHLEWSTNGLWVGIGLPVSITRRFGLTAEGWYFVPGNRHVMAAGRGFVSRQGLPFYQEGNLNITSEWFTAELRGAYRIPYGLTLLAGVRYDYLQGTISASSDAERLIVRTVGVPFDAQVDVNLNSIFPYVGLMYNTGVEANRLSISVKGFPAAISASGDTPDRAYFGEIGFEWSFNPLGMRNLALAFFAKADAAHAVFSEVVDVQNAFRASPTVGGPFSFRVIESLSLDWKQIFIGSTVTFNFDLPLPF